jgi:hypothetical protein
MIIPVVVKITWIPKPSSIFPRNRFPNIISNAMPRTISGKAIGRSKILFTKLLRGKEYLEREYAVGIAIIITKNAANIEVDNVNLSADIISSEKSDCINPSGEGIRNMLPIIMNNNAVKIKDMDIKIISNLLLILYTDFQFDYFLLQAELSLYPLYYY